jgi:hypothetical protein
MPIKVVPVSMTTCWSVMPSDLPPTWMSCSGMAQYPAG